MFNLVEADLRLNILGCGDGPASFNAELTARGGTVISCDPLYDRSGAQIAAQFEHVAPIILAEVQRTQENFIWTYHRNSEQLLQQRRLALERFLLDYEVGKRDGRYVFAKLPNLPFAGGQFDLALCSHLLFLYSQMLGADFHWNSIVELCRVAREVRIFPLVDLTGKNSSYLGEVLARAPELGLRGFLQRTSYQFQRNGSHFLRIERL